MTVESLWPEEAPGKERQEDCYNAIGERPDTRASFPRRLREGLGRTSAALRVSATGKMVEPMVSPGFLGLVDLGGSQRNGRSLKPVVKFLLNRGPILFLALSVKLPKVSFAIRRPHRPLESIR